jgi:hypothetical protein
MKRPPDTLDEYRPDAQQLRKVGERARDAHDENTRNPALQRAVGEHAATEAAHPDTAATSPKAPPPPEELDELKALPEGRRHLPTALSLRPVPPGVRPQGAGPGPRPGGEPPGRTVPMKAPPSQGEARPGHKAPVAALVAGGVAVALGLAYAATRGASPAPSSTARTDSAPSPTRAPEPPAAPSEVYAAQPPQPPVAEVPVSGTPGQPRAKATGSPSTTSSAPPPPAGSAGLLPPAGTLPRPPLPIPPALTARPRASTDIF